MRGHLKHGPAAEAWVSWHWLCISISHTSSGSGRQSTTKGSAQTTQLPAMGGERWWGLDDSMPGSSTLSKHGLKHRGYQHPKVGHAGMAAPAQKPDQLHSRRLQLVR